MKNIWVVLFFFVSLNVFCQSINDQPNETEYVPMQRVSTLPQFDERQIMDAIIYPPIALRSGIEGRVILELFVDNEGQIRQVIILQEEPLNMGFGEAAVNAFQGIKGEPARLNGEAVSVRFRYPVSFRIR
jgi:protein TonB